ncbi:hypothetical protein [uncultured Kordia sp.]|uniref:hypothetical protein n=1 Tax=uncultured Kordia sp. TaxID=507699 RepID=UPI002623F9D9|nr:hypothetical protein [uncultured Kordia sp.]
MEDLERKIKELYGTQSLSSEQLQRITSEKGKKTLLKSLIVRKYAAVFLFMVMVSSSLYCLYFFSSNSQDNILHGFASEIAYNHQKKTPPKIKTNSVAELNAQLPDLNFKISLPARITDKFQLKGGHYCSVDNRIAAQLRFENEAKEKITCYVFKKEEDFNFDTAIAEKNTKVTLWDAGDLIYAIAVDN